MTDDTDKLSRRVYDKLSGDTAQALCEEFYRRRTLDVADCVTMLMHLKTEERADVLVKLCAEVGPIPFTHALDMNGYQLR
jgi:predicted ArsR family transcriptional regulator